MKHKVSELTGALLDTAVARSEGWQLMPGMSNVWAVPSRVRGIGGDWIDTSTVEPTRPWSTDWTHGGPIIERKRITLVPFDDGDGQQWSATTDKHRGYIDESLPFWGIGSASGATALVAAMRAYVAGRFGPEIEV